MSEFKIVVASEEHLPYVEVILQTIADAAKIRGTGIAKRSPEYLQKKMEQGNAIIALTETGNWAGFCYIEVWSHEKFVANSGLIVSLEFREFGLAKRIKQYEINILNQLNKNGITIGS